MRTRHNIYAAWLACLALLLASLAPSISQAIAAQKSGIDPLHEICASTGLKTADASGHQTPGDHTLHFEHCPFCSNGSTPFALPPHSFSLPVLTDGHIVPSLFYESPRPLFALTSAQSRAPPSAI